MKMIHHLSQGQRIKKLKIQQQINFKVNYLYTLETSAVQRQERLNYNICVFVPILYSL